MFTSERQLCGTHRAPEPGPGADRRAGGAGRSASPRAGEQPAVQQPRLLVPADLGERLCNGHHSHDAAPAFGAVCSGERAGGSPVAIKNAVGEPRTLFVFAASQPVRYLACVVSRLLPVDTRTLDAPETRRTPSPPRYRRAVCGAVDRRVCDRAAAWTRAGTARRAPRTLPAYTPASCTTRRSRA